MGNLRQITNNEDNDLGQYFISILSRTVAQILEEGRWRTPISVAAFHERKLYSCLRLSIAFSFVANIIDLHWPLKTYIWIVCVCSAFRKLHGLYGLPDEVPTCLRWRVPLRQGGVSNEREQGELWLKRCSLSFLCFQKPVDQCCAGRLGEYHTRLNDR